MNRLKLENSMNIMFAFLMFSTVLFGLFLIVPTTTQRSLEETETPKQAFNDEQFQFYFEQEKREETPKPQQNEVTALSVAQTDYSKQKVHYTDKVIVLTYHHIDEKENGITISPKRFKSHLQKLKSNDYNVISMEQFLHFMKKEAKVPQNAVVITFDDGYESFYTYAYPELKNFGFVATKFIVVESIDHPKAPRLTWDQMREMKKNGMSFYSHTYNLHDKASSGANTTQLPMLTTHIYLSDKKRPENEEEYRNRIKSDLITADRRIEEELGPQTRLLAFPFGAYNETAIGIGKELGIELFFTTKEGINTNKSNEISRVHAGAAYISDEDLMKKMLTYK